MSDILKIEYHTLIHSQMSFQNSVFLTDFANNNNQKFNFKSSRIFKLLQTCTKVSNNKNMLNLNKVILIKTACNKDF